VGERPAKKASTEWVFVVLAISFSLFYITVLEADSGVLVGRFFINLRAAD